MITLLVDITGYIYFPDCSPTTFQYDGSNRVTSITKTWKTDVFKKTFAYDGNGNVVSDSGWVKQ